MRLFRRKHEHEHTCLWDPMDGHVEHECECGKTWRTP